MISNNKQNCIYDLSSSIKRTAIWRRRLQAKYNDPGNGRAAENLERLAIEVTELTDEQWSQLLRFYDWASGTWSDAISQTSRLVGFRNVNTLPAFVDQL